MGTKLGLDCILYRGTAGAIAPIEMKNVRDLALNIEKGEADITTRAAKGWKMTAATLKEGSIEFDLVYDAQNSDFTTLEAAFLCDVPLAFFVSDGDGNGLDCDCDVTKFDLDQSLEEAVKASVTLKPTNIGGSAGRAPVWRTGVVISGGTVVNSGAILTSASVVTSGGTVSNG